MTILFLVLIGFGLYYFMKNDTNSYCSMNQKKKSPEEILKERFVNGEIDEETYLKMKKTLNK